MPRSGSETGFSLIEVLIGLAILMAAVVPIAYLADSSQRLARAHSEATDLHQRTRVAMDRLQRDLTIAGAGPRESIWEGPLAAFVPPVMPARTGVRLPDAELAAFPDRLTVFYVADDGWSTRLSADMPDASAGVPIDASAPGCPAAGLCGFTPGTRAVVLDTTAVGAGHDVFTVAAVNGELAHGAPFSRAYESAAASVMPIVQRVYHFDRSTRRLMVYDGDQSDVPFIDNVVDVRFELFADASAGLGLRRMAVAELADGPAIGISPHRFDADLLRVRMVRVTLRLQAAADEVRGTGAWFARPGRSQSGMSFVPDVQVTLDVAIRNRAGRP